MRIPAGLERDQVPLYVNGAAWFSASSRSLDGLAGVISRKPPIVTVPPAVEPWLRSVTPTGVPFATFADQVVRETIAVGRCGILVDVPSEGGDPYFSLYFAENILNWRQQVVSGRPVLSLLVLREHVSLPDEQDEFVTTVTDRFRVVRLVRGADEGQLAVEVTVWQREQGDSGDFVVIAGPLLLTRRGDPLTRIPFTFINPNNLDPTVADPPLEGLADINLSHWQTSAELEHVAYHVGAPVYVISGSFQNDTDMTELKVGATVAWQLEKDARAEVLTVGPDGLGALERRLEVKLFAVRRNVSLRRIGRLRIVQ